MWLENLFLTVLVNVVRFYVLAMFFVLDHFIPENNDSYILAKLTVFYYLKLVSDFFYWNALSYAIIENFDFFYRFFELVGIRYARFLIPQ